MSLKDKSSESIKSAYLLKENNLYNSATNRFYYAVFMKTLDFTEDKLNYDYDNLSSDEKKSSHKTLINFLNDAISDLRKDSDKAFHVNKINTIKGDFIRLSYLRVKADYESDTITEEDMKEVEKNYNDFNDKYSILKSMFS